MPDRFYKKSRFEILAILREDCRINSILILKHKGNKLQSILEKIDGHYFSAELTSFVPLQHVEYNFILHSHLGKLEFSTYLFLKENGNQQKNIYRFKIPNNIKISQRRVSPRILINNQSQFFISGHNENGREYKFTINDISEGGVSFITNSLQTDLINKGAVFNHVEVTLGEYGSTVTSIKVVSVTDLNTEQTLGLKKVRVSCAFHNKSTEAHKHLENVMLQLTIDKKNKTRRF